MCFHKRWMRQLSPLIDFLILKLPAEYDTSYTEKFRLNCSPIACSFHFDCIEKLRTTISPHSPPLPTAPHPRVTIIWILYFPSVLKCLLFGVVYICNVRLQRSTALHAASALRSLYGTTYVVGTGADTLCKLSVLFAVLAVLYFDVRSCKERK